MEKTYSKYPSVADFFNYPAKEQTLDRALYVVRISPESIVSMPRQYREAVMVAVRKDGMLLQHVRKPDLGIILTAIRQNPLAIKFAKKQPSWLQIMACGLYGWAYFSIRKPVKAARLAAISSTPRIVRMLPGITPAEVRLALQLDPGIKIEV